jgi:hypothetical protein
VLEAAESLKEAAVARCADTVDREPATADLEQASVVLGGDAEAVVAVVLAAPGVVADGVDAAARKLPRLTRISWTRSWKVSCRLVREHTFPS